MTRLIIPFLLLSLSLPLSAAAELVTAEPAFQRVLLTGYTRARRNMPLTAEAEGRVLTVAADIGEPIPADGEFTCVDGTFVRLDLQANRARQQQLRADVDFFRKQTRRFQDLLKRKTTAQSEVDKAQHDLDTHGHQLDALKVEERRLQERLLRCCVAAPAGWQVTAREVEPGQWIATGQRVGEVADFNSLLIPLSLDPVELAALRAVTDLSVMLPGLGKRVPVRIERISPAFDATTRKVSVDLLIAADAGLAAGQRRGGLRVTLALQIPDVTGAVMVPKRALRQSYEQHYLLREDGSRVAVVVLANGGERVRVSAAEVNAGAHFLTAAPPDGAADTAP